MSGLLLGYTSITHSDQLPIVISGITPMLVRLLPKTVLTCSGPQC